jgi:hypothetical protein
MVTSYFDEVVGTLTNEDTYLLGVLVDKDATAKFKGLGNAVLQELSGTSEANFRKVTTRLKAQKFIESNADYKERSLYITPFGMAAFLKVQNMVRVV